MPSLTLTPSSTFLAIALVVLLARPVSAFGAGNIASMSKVEGVNWRHGDIEDTLLTLMMAKVAGGKKFDKMSIKRIYFGNWLRDYSQAIDVGTVKYVSAEAIRILLWVLGFMTFGYGTGEFEVTSSRLGCYRPEDHIDNPKDYADNLDATKYERRLRGPVNERVELAIDPRTGMKNYIANEHVGIMTSALHVRKLFEECIRLGRSYGRSKNKDELYEALRLMGTGLHCLEDYSAHSNYTELALIEMGERDVFPHVGRQTQMRLEGAQHPVYPLITGTFGGVDFLHSVMGEFDDKATQSEIQMLEGTMQNSSQADTSMLKNLLSSLPSGLFAGEDNAAKADELQANATAAQMEDMHVSPRQPEAFTLQMQKVAKDIYPIIEWHDNLMKRITGAIDKIPVLPDLIEKLENQVNVFVFSLLAPFVVPIIGQIKTELNEGSSEIIQSSKDKQLIVFSDDYSTDPTHSMLSKDHFSNVLNEPAGKIASQVLAWTVPQIMQAWDDERVDPTRTINRIVNGVFHHPAQRHMGEDGAADGRRLMFGVVEQWWRSANQNELRRKLSRQGVQNLENHLEGVHDTGHGCGGPLGMAKNTSGASSKPMGGVAGGLMGALSGGSGGQGDIGKFAEQAMGGGGASSGIGKFAGEAVGGGALGGLVGSLAGGVGGSLLSGVFGGRDEPKTQSYASEGRTQEGGYQQSYSEFGQSGNQYAQAQYSETQLPGGGRETDYQRYEQQGQRGTGFEERTQDRPTYGGGYEQTTERTYQRSGEVETETYREGRTGDGRQYHQSQSEFRSKKKKDSSDDSGDSDGDSDSSKKKKKKDKKKDKKKKHHEYSEREQREDYIAPSSSGGGYGGGYGEPPRETFEERRHDQEYQAQPSYGYEAPRREERNEYRSEPSENQYRSERSENQYENPGYASRGHGDEAGWGQEPRREERYGGQERGGDEYQETRRDDEYRRDDRDEERREGGGGGGWFN